MAKPKNYSMIAPFLLFLLLPSAVRAHNITHILADHPEFSTFNHYLSTTHLAAEINRRRTITVCAVDNAGMSDLLSKHLSLEIIKNVLSLHIFADYFGAKKLHEITDSSTTTSTLFQATGEAAGTSGYVNITDMKEGKVGFAPADSNSDKPMATFVKSVEELPYNISVIQISHILSSPEAEAPATGPNDVNFTSVLAKQGCKAFSDLIIAQGVEATFAESVHGGLTIFCPSAETLKSFTPRYNSLKSDEKTAVLLYHAVPIYNSLEMLRSSNGLMNTLATEGANKYDFTVQNDGDDVKIETKVVTATITSTLVDEDPLAAYRIDKVLQPREIFKAEKPARSRARSREVADAPGPAGDDAPADEDSSSGSGRSVGGGRNKIVELAFSVLAGLFVWSC